MRSAGTDFQQWKCDWNYDSWHSFGKPIFRIKAFRPSWGLWGDDATPPLRGHTKDNEEQP